MWIVHLEFYQKGKAPPPPSPKDRSYAVCIWHLTYCMLGRISSMKSFSIRCMLMLTLPTTTPKWQMGEALGSAGYREEATTQWDYPKFKSVSHSWRYMVHVRVCTLYVATNVEFQLWDGCGQVTTHYNRTCCTIMHLPYTLFRNIR